MLDLLVLSEGFGAHRLLVQGWISRLSEQATVEKQSETGVPHGTGV